MTSTDRSGRWAWAEVDLDAIRHNVEALRRMVAPSMLWAVVKANGYGHGAVPVARAALDAGAAGLCVALVQEGEELRAAGIDAPILLLSQQPPEQLDRLVSAGLTPTVYSADAIERLTSVAPADGIDVHLKIDTGMQRVGAAPEDALALAASIDGDDRLRLAGVFTHLAAADDPDSSATDRQLDVFAAALDAVRDSGIEPPLVHAANSAGAMRVPAAHRSFVRAGIAIYGISPAPALDDLAVELRPAMRLVARVSHVKRVDAGTHVSYGWRHRFDRATTAVTVPLGYADGVPRRMGTLPDRPGADVLIGGRRCPIVGVVTMDQFVVDVGDERVNVGDEVVLLGEQGDQRIRAEDWADRLGTIGYEIVCGISARIGRFER